MPESTPDDEPYPSCEQCAGLPCEYGEHLVRDGERWCAACDWNDGQVSLCESNVEVVHV